MRSLLRLRRSLSLSLAVLLSVAAAAPALARDLFISKSDTVIVQLVWGEGEPTSPSQSWGGLGTYGQGETAGLWFNDTQVQLVMCDAGTPEPEDDYQGYRGTSRVGDGTATSQSIARDLRTASAAGVITIYSVVFDDCAGVWEILDVEADVLVSFALRANGAREQWVDVYRERVPGEYDIRQLSRMRGHHATGTAEVGGVPLEFADALIARFSSLSQWRS